MVTTPMEITEALVSVGVPEARAQRIAHAADGSECDLSEDELAQSIQTMNNGSKTLFNALARSQDAGLRQYVLRTQEAINVGFKIASEARGLRLQERFDEYDRRADRRHRQLMFVIWGFGVVNIALMGAMLVALFLLS